MDDAVASYRAASEANDLDALMETIAPDAELVSPLSGRMVFRGHGDLRVLLGAVYSTLRDLRWEEELGDGKARVLMGRCRVGPLRMSDAMAFDLAEDGRIRRIRPHLRPWLATTLFALLLGPRVGRHPGAVMRALRRP
jgi:SnoaL-like domain